uniref:Eka-like protein n=1 Tax=Loa loa TaxID=7209 RepID=A0A1I7VYE7_LOALO
MDTKLTIDKLGQKPRYNPGGTSALSMVRSNSKPLSSAVRSNQHSSQLNHWDSECDAYPTANGRRNRLKLLKECLICFKDSHNGERCEIKKQCFYCKALHNSALCDSRSTASSNSLVHSEVKGDHENLQIPPKMDYSPSLYNSTNTTRTNTTKETLLLCKEAKKLSQQLKLTESDKQIMKITPFGMRNPTLCATASTQLKVQTMENDLISNVQELSSSHMLVQSEVGPMIAGSGDRWNCEEIINELQASFIIDKENNTNPYLMKGNIILDMANGNDENLTKKSPRAIRKQLLMMETSPEETFDPNNVRINAELELAHNQDAVNTSSTKG